MPGRKAVAKKTAKPRLARKLKVASASPASDYALVFAALRDVMAVHATKLHITANEPRKYSLVTKSKSWRGGPMFFGAVMWGKAYVSYHLMPLYIWPELKKRISPELMRRMQGKACFNFRDHDPRLLSELGDLTESALAALRAKKFL